MNKRDRIDTTRHPRPGPTFIQNPILVVGEGDDGTLTVAMQRGKHCDGFEAYGMLICDLVRHAARAFSVPEAAVWEWVDKERAKPTGGLDTPKTS